MADASHTRLRRPRFSFFTGLAVTLGITILSLVLLFALRVDWGTNLGVSGIVFAIATFIITELRQREAPRKDVVYIAQSDTVFNENILDGLREKLSDAFPSHLTVQSPTPSDLRHLEDWQVGVLQSSQVRRAAAVVVAPPRDDEKIWEEIIDLMRTGVFVVVIDILPNTRFFTDRGLQPPAFVGSDFVKGGRSIGVVIARELQKDPDTWALICLGPDDSWSGATRSNWLTYELARSGVLSQVDHYELPSWHPEEFLDDLYSHIIGRTHKGAKTGIVYCGTDRIMQALERRLALPEDSSLTQPQRGLAQSLRNLMRANRYSPTTRLLLIGYDGVTTNDGRPVAADCPHALATVNTRPRAQGWAAAQLLHNAYDNDASRPRIHIVEPAVLSAPDWNS